MVITTNFICFGVLSSPALDQPGSGIERQPLL